MGRAYHSSRDFTSGIISLAPEYVQTSYHYRWVASVSYKDIDTLFLPLLQKFF